MRGEAQHDVGLPRIQRSHRLHGDRGAVREFAQGRRDAAPGLRAQPLDLARQGATPLLDLRVQGGKVVGALGGGQVPPRRRCRDRPGRAARPPRLRTPRFPAAGPDRSARPPTGRPRRAARVPSARTSRGPPPPGSTRQSPSHRGIRDSSGVRSPGRSPERSAWHRRRECRSAPKPPGSGRASRHR